GPLAGPRVRTLFPYTTLFRSLLAGHAPAELAQRQLRDQLQRLEHALAARRHRLDPVVLPVAIERGDDRVGIGDVREAALVELQQDRKSTRLNSSHARIPYAVF